MSAPRSTPSWIPAARILPSWSRPFRRTAEPPWAGISSCTALLWKQLRSRGIPGAPSRSPISPPCLSGQTARQVGHVGIKSVAAGLESVLAAMERMIAAGKRVIVCDAWQEDHLRMAAAAAARLGRSILWVGSAGLAEHLPSVLGLAAAPPEDKPEGVQSCGGQARRRPGGQHQQRNPGPGQDARTENGHRLRRGRPLRTAKAGSSRPGDRPLPGGGPQRRQDRKGRRDHDWLERRRHEPLSGRSRCIGQRRRSPPAWASCAGGSRRAPHWAVSS